MKVSIIVPIFNVESEIETCLISVFFQDYQDIELILINDASQDNSYELARKLIEEYDFAYKTILIEHKNNRGLSAARNSGIECASGEYLFFLDSDDALASEDAISSMVEIVKQNNNLDFISGHFQRVIEDDVMSISTCELAQYDTTFDIYRAYIDSKIPVIACAKLIHKKFLVNNALYFKEGIYHEDELWFFRVSRKAQKAYVTPKVIYNYMIRPGSISFKYDKKNIVGLISVFSEMVKIYRQESEFYAKDTVWQLEQFRRTILLRIYALPDKKYRRELIQQLRDQKLPFLSGSMKFTKQNILMRMPLDFIIWYLNIKWRT